LDKGDYRRFSEWLLEGPDSTTFDPLKSPLKKLKNLDKGQ
jgi:hypothetical protein